MICPHCHKPISRNVSKEAKSMILKLHKEGYSLRDIESLIKTNGEQISFSTIGRFLRGSKK